jgi:hypothetical protein
MLWNLQLARESDQDGPRKFQAYGRGEGCGWTHLDYDPETDEVTACDAPTPADPLDVLRALLPPGTTISSKTKLARELRDAGVARSQQGLFDWTAAEVLERERDGKSFTYRVRRTI